MVHDLAEVAVVHDLVEVAVDHDLMGVVEDHDLMAEVEDRDLMVVVELQRAQEGEGSHGLEVEAGPHVQVAEVAVPSKLVGQVDLLEEVEAVNL